MSRPQSSYDAQSQTGIADFAHGNVNPTSPLSQSMNQNTGAFTEDFDASQRGSSFVDDGAVGADRTHSDSTTAVPAPAPSRNNTLKKRNSVKRTTSLKRSSSKRSLKAGSLAGFGGVDSNQEYYSVFSTPIPTQGAPTEILANRFQAWRQLLKSLIAYFREIQASYEIRAKAAHKVQASITNIAHPAIFMSEHGLGEATKILDDFHKRSISEANKSREIEADVIGALSGLRSDLSQKIKEIKSLSGDFKNSVEKEKDGTRREVEKYQEALKGADHDDGSAMGKNDPFVIKLGVDRAVERQLDEENYLHRAYLNLESSGRELETIVVGEIQKAYNAMASILKREGDDAYHAVEALRTGPISMPKDAEWKAFVQKDDHFVDPNVPLRRVEDIHYPGRNHPAAAEVRAGMLERKSKYLKSYTAGWYVLSPTHLHEFKSADKIYSQPPVMSLYLHDQKLGSHSQQGSSSHKFMVKGKQSGNMHKGHNWVFRAETYDTMMAWFEDMRILTEKSGEERNAFVRKHARSFSGNSDKATVSSDGMDEDEADAVPYSADVSSLPPGTPEVRPQRPQPGGRFPSDFAQQRDRGISMGQSSGSSDPNAERDAMAMSSAFAGPSQVEYTPDGPDPYRLEGVSAGTRTASAYTGGEPSYVEDTPSPEESRYAAPGLEQVQPRPAFLEPQPMDQRDLSAEQVSHRDWIAPAAAGVGVVSVGAVMVGSREEQPEDQIVMPPHVEKPEVPEKSSLRSSPPESTKFAAADVPSDQPLAGATASTAEPILAPTTKFAAADVPSDQPLTEAATSTATPISAAPAEFAPADVPSDQPLTGAAPSTATPISVPATDLAPTSELGGLEHEGAHETGAIFPSVIRHDTNMSISQLHVPGKFPKQE